jgi:hypothetical protein
MSLKSKTAAALTVLALAATFAMPATDANAKGKGWAIGAGILGAAIVGSAIANSYAYDEPVYYDDGPRCRLVPRYNAYGDYVGRAKVCRW